MTILINLCYIYFKHYIYIWKEGMNSLDLKAYVSQYLARY